MNKTIILLAGSLLMFGNALADNNDLNNLNQQNLSRQPYKHPVDKSNTGNFEGATVTKEQAEIDKKNHNLQLHRFDRRPYMKKSTEQS